MLRRRQGILAALLAAIAIISAQIAMKRPDVLQPDERTYLDVINPLLRTGIFTDGSMTASGTAGEPGRFLAPAYPVMVAGLARMDGKLAATLSCLGASSHKELRTVCGSLWTLQASQAVVAAIGVTAVFVIALMLTGSRAVAWATLLLVLATGEPAGYARLILTDTLATTALYLFTAALVALMTTGSTFAAAAAGIAIGFATLARPGYAYLFYAAGLVVLAVGLLRSRIDTTVRPMHGPLLIACGFLVLTPWMARNWLIFGDTALTAGYGALALAQRVAYNAMTWSEWAAAWVYWLPDVGDDIARALFKPETTHRLGFNAPDTFYQIGTGALHAQTLAAAGSEDRHLGYLISTHIVGDLFKHIMVTLTLVWRGMWAGKWLGVAALLLAWPVLRGLIRSGKLTALLAMALPLLFMLGLHAFVSVNVVRYNVPMISLYALVVSMAAVDLGRRLADRRKRGAGEARS